MVRVVASRLAMTKRKPQFKAQLADLGSSVLAGPPAEFSKLIADETEKWGRVIRTANIKLE